MAVVAVDQGRGADDTSRRHHHVRVRRVGVCVVQDGRRGSVGFDIESATAAVFVLEALEHAGDESIRPTDSGGELVTPIATLDIPPLFVCVVSRRGLGLGSLEEVWEKGETPPPPGARRMRC